MPKRKFHATNNKNDSTAEEIICWWCGKPIKPGQYYRFKTIKDPTSGTKTRLLMHEKCAEEFERSGGWSELYEP